jgi:hypothetical protein
MSDFIRFGVVSFTFGALLLLIALVGGALEVKEVRFGQITQRSRIALGVAGLVFIGLGLWVTLLDQSTDKPVAQDVSKEPETSVTANPGTTSSSTSSTLTNTTLESFPAVAERELLSLVPSGIRDDCERDEDPYEGTTVSVVCTPNAGANTAYYMTFRTADQMKKFYFDFLDNNNIKQDAGDCTRKDTEEFPYTIEGKAAGRYACYPKNEGLWIMWTHDKLRVLSMGFRNDADVKKLKKWWTDDAGPIEP